MNKTLLTLILISFATAIVTISCNHYDSIMQNPVRSSFGSRSHNAGDDCMVCHHDNTSGASTGGKWWYYAGTVYTTPGHAAFSAGKLRLWSALDSVTHKGSGKLIDSVEIDTRGNIYSGKIISFAGGAYPQIVSNSGSDTTMQQKIDLSNPSCNSASCHDGINSNPGRIILKP